MENNKIAQVNKWSDLNQQKSRNIEKLTNDYRLVMEDHKSAQYIIPRQQISKFREDFN